MIKKKGFTMKLAAVAVVAAVCALGAAAFPVSRYATTSRLNTGTWVKIDIAQTGMYQITYDELQAMGFSNPANVRRNIEWANEEPDWNLVKEVQEIIGDQQRVTWANS